MEVSNLAANVTLRYPEHGANIIIANSGMFKTHFNTSAVVGYMLGSAYGMEQPLPMTGKPMINTNINTDK